MIAAVAVAAARSTAAVVAASSSINVRLSFKENFSNSVFTN